MVPRGVAPLLSKRALGWLSWRTHRSDVHRPEVLEALLSDLHEVSPDQTVITGDLTNVSLESEFVAAREWLSRIGPPERVTVVPGNHDAYVSVPRATSWDLWTEYLASDAAGAGALGDDPEADDDAKPELTFPSLRLRGPLAIVGACSAVPTAPLLAAGALGRRQLERLERVLGSLADRDLFRVLLIHHPPLPGIVTRRRALRDAAALCELLGRTGADLVLHGHLHRTRFSSIEGPEGPIPVVGVRAASDHGSKPGKRAQYHLYDIESLPGRRRFHIELRTRGYDGDRFIPDGTRTLVSGA